MALSAYAAQELQDEALQCLRISLLINVFGRSLPLLIITYAVYRRQVFVYFTQNGRQILGQFLARQRSTPTF